MPQLHLYVPDKVARELRQRARSRGLTVSRYLAQLVHHDVGDEWPKGFFERVVGKWAGDLKRPRQGAYEKREVT